MMEISTYFGSVVSYIGLLRKHPEFFYHQPGIALEWSWSGILQKEMRVDGDKLNSYTHRFTNGRIELKRSFPEKWNTDKSLPNIVELTIWWICVIDASGKYHDIRSMRTPSSTIFENKTLCLSFWVNRYLAVQPHCRTSYSAQVINPN